MPNRSGSSGSYRYGFQDQEMDDEIKGTGNSVNYKFRMHDPRVGRFFAVDPLARKFAHWSPYAFSGNQVIHTIELEGLETEENLNEGEVEVKPTESGQVVTEDKEHEVMISMVKEGKEGDCIGCYPEIYIMLTVIDMMENQQEVFAEAADGVVLKDNSGVEICSKSVLGVEILTQLEEKHGITETDLTKKEKKQLLTIVWTKLDMSELFIYSPSNVKLIGIAPTAPIAIPRVAPVVMPRGGGIASGTVAINAHALGGKIVDEFAKTSSGGRAKKRAQRKEGETSSADSEYKKKNPHRTRKNGNRKKKHEKGEATDKKNQGGEKGDVRRTRNK